MPLLILLMLFPLNAFAQKQIIKPDVIESFYGYKNYIKNSSGFKNVNNITTSNATATRDTDSADALDGIASIVCDASAQNGYCAFTTETITEGDKTGNCAASAQFKGDASLYKLAVHDGSNYLAYSQVLTNASDWTEVSVNYPCGSTRQVRLVQTEAGTGAAVNIGRVFWGKAPNLQNVSQARFLGSASYATTASCVFNRTGVGSDSYATHLSLTDSDCPTQTVKGQAIAPATKTASIRFPSIPKGRLLLIARGDFRKAGTTDALVKFRFSDGTNTSTEQMLYPSTLNFGTPVLTGFIDYTSSAGDTTIELQGLTASTSNTVQIVISDGPFAIEAYHYPSEDQMAVRPDSQGWFVDVNIAGANPSLGTSSVSSYTEITSGSFSMTQNTGSSGAQIPCSSTNASTGLTCSSGSESIGVVFNAPEAGQYRVCGEFTHLYRLNAASTYVQTAFQFVETSNTSQTIVQEGKSRTNSGFQIAAGSGVDHEHYGAVNTCGTFYFASAGQKTIRLMYEQQVGGTILGSTILADADSAAGQRDIHITVERMSGSQNAPLLVGSVTSDSTGLERIGRVKITNSGTPSISSQSGSWVSSLTDNGAGDVTVNFKSGFFSSAPTCVPTATAASNNVDCTNYSDETTSSVRVICQYPTGFAGSGTGFDTNFSMICFGPR